MSTSSGVCKNCGLTLVGATCGYTGFCNLCYASPSVSSSTSPSPSVSVSPSVSISPSVSASAPYSGMYPSSVTASWGSWSGGTSSQMESSPAHEKKTEKLKRMLKKII